jgi:hypothetical protein
MSNRSRSAKRILAWFLTSLLLAPALPAFAQDDDDDGEGGAEAAETSGPRAVERWNAWVGGEYAHRETDPRSSLLGGRNAETGEWLVVGNLTVPVFRAFGARVQLFGGEHTVDPNIGGLSGSETSAIGAAFEAFWRDPGLGTVAVGYAITHQSTVYDLGSAPGGMVFVPPSFEENVQTFSASGALFWGDLDLEAAVGVSPRTAGTIGPFNQSETGSRATEIYAGAGARYYVTDWLALRAAFFWIRDDRALVLSSATAPPSEFGQAVGNSYEGRFAVQTQLPTIGRGPIFLSLFGTVGGSDIDWPAGVLDYDPMYWEVGGAIVLAYPRPETIKEWVRMWR